MKRFATRVILALTAVTLISLAFGLNTVSADFCAELQGDYGAFLDCDNHFSSFTSFEGGLTPPDANDFDPSLTEARDLRTFIKNVSNFALSFLGLIAVLIIIYSGFLYVTSRGESEQMEKGKKGITYAVIGIIIILSSFAIVNTVIRAPSGDGRSIEATGSFRGVGPGGLTNAAQLASFNSAAEDIKDIAVEFIRTYEKHYDQSVRLSKLTTIAPEEWTTRRDYIDYLTFLKGELAKVKRVSSSLSKTSVSIQLVVDQVLDPGLQAVGEKIERETTEELSAKYYRNDFEEFINGIEAGIGEAVRGLLGSDDESRMNYECLLPPSERSVNIDVSGCDTGSLSLVDNDFGLIVDDAFDDLIIDIVLEQGVFADYDQDLELYRTRIENIKNSLISNNGRSSAITSEVDRLFEPVINALDTTHPDSVSSENVFFLFPFRNDAGDFSDILSDDELGAALTKNDAVKKLVQDLDDLYEEMQRIKFTAPYIEANTFVGSAPLIITFDGSKTYDPSDRTVPDENYNWDIDGDGEFDSTTTSINNSSVECFEDDGSLKKASVTCIYKNPGSYRVALQVESEADEEFVGAGIAYASIRVTPPVSQIDLVAEFAGKEEVLRRYDDEGNIAKDIGDLYVTSTEAIDPDTGGITFDATGTTGNKIVNYEWFFSDSGEEIAGSQQDKVVQKKFTETGTFDAFLAVTDEQGNVDRKFFQIHIESIVARINTDATEGIPGSEFEFDASASQSDSSPISSWVWTVDGTDPEGGNNGGEQFTHTFDEPGSHQVGLEVSNGRDSATTTLEIEIESQTPLSSFEITNPEPSRPSYVVLDATRSFDPDPNDVLTYNWRIFNAVEGVNYDIEFGQFDGNEEESSRVGVLFKKTGTYTIELKVSDQHEAALKKTATTTNVANIQSLVDVAFDESQIFASQLEADSDGDLVAPAEFIINSEFAETVSINYGDGDSDEDRITGGTITFNHEYERAGSYDVVVTAEKGNDSTKAENTFIVGGGDTTIAVPKVTIGDNTFTNTDDLPEVYKKSTITFDASSSLNSDGTDRGLSYSWNFGDGEVSTRKTIQHKYEDLPPSDPGYFEVTLTVTSDEGESDTATMQLNVVGAKPEAQSLIATALGGPNTPYPVKLEVIGPKDLDGRVVQYRYYYYPIDDPDRKLGLKSSEFPTGTVDVKTFGVQGEEVEYVFCADLIDNEGNEVDCLEIFGEEKLPKMTVVNGPNDPPQSRFRVDRTSVTVGETVNFFDQSTDPDGEIIEWTYDFEGDNSFVNDETYEQPSVSYQYKKAGTFKVKLRVMDDKGATSVSEPLNIFVDSFLDPPTAAFTFVTTELTAEFAENARADYEAGGEIIKYEWDFDTSRDTDGDGDPANDVDDIDPNPFHTYPTSGSYEVQLTVTDSEYNEDVVTRQVIIQEIPDNYNDPFDTSTTPPNIDNPGQPTDPTVTPSSDIDIEIVSNPPVDLATDTIYVSGDSAEVTFDFSRVRGNIARVVIDKNIYFDTNSAALGTLGDGIRNNDVDYESNNLNSWTTTYLREWSPIRVQITVVDTNGNLSRDEADIVFSNSPFQAYLSLSTGRSVAATLYFVLLFGVSLYGAFVIRRNSKRTKKRKL